MNNIHRDAYSGAIVNYDADGYEQAKMRKHIQKKKKQLEYENASLNTRINNLEHRINELERLLFSILNKS